MKYIQLEKSFEGNRTLSFHKPLEIKPISSGEPFIIEVKLGSWYNEQLLLTGSTPDAYTIIELTKPSNLDTQLFLNTIIEQIVAIPDWQNSTIIDLSLPTPLPVEEDD